MLNANRSIISTGINVEQFTQRTKAVRKDLEGLRVHKAFSLQNDVYCLFDNQILAFSNSGRENPHNLTRLLALDKERSI